MWYVNQTIVKLCYLPKKRGNYFCCRICRANTFWFILKYSKSKLIFNFRSIGINVCFLTCYNIENLLQSVRMESFIDFLGPIMQEHPFELHTNLASNRIEYLFFWIAREKWTWNNCQRPDKSETSWILVPNISYSQNHLQFLLI